MILVICLAVSVFILLLVIVVCVLKKKKKESQDSIPNSPETQRPFILGDQQQQLLQQQQQQQMLQQQQGKLLHKPLPPTPFMPHQWTNSVYPKMSNQPLVVVTTDSGFTEHDNSKEFESSGNQYEVPYAHLLPVGSSTGSNSTTTSNNNNNRRHFLRSSDCVNSASHPFFDGGMTSRSGPISGFSSEHPTYALKQHQHLQYFSDYDSQ